MPEYRIASANHIDASTSTIRQLVDLVTVRTGSRQRTLHVRISHVNHGAFLAMNLYQFAVIPASGTEIALPVTPILETKPRVASVLLSPDSCTSDEPFVLALSINHEIERQIESALTGLAQLVSRQELTRPQAEWTDLDLRLGVSDEQATQSISDEIRLRGWQAAAMSIAERSRAASLPLSVSYSEVLMEPGQLAARAPILRRVYNEIELARRAVDKTVSLISQGMYVTASGGPRGIVDFARDMLDMMSSRVYTAHVIRDALVCGNGYLHFGGVPGEDIRLLQPEFVRLLGHDGTVKYSNGAQSSIYRDVLHETGARQVGSAYGVSVLEPYVQLLVQKELVQHQIDTYDAWLAGGAPSHVVKSLERNLPTARRSLDAVASQIKAISGAAVNIEVAVPRDLYFPGYERMEPAAEAVSLASNQETHLGIR